MVFYYPPDNLLPISSRYNGSTIVDSLVKDTGKVWDLLLPAYPESFQLTFLLTQPNLVVHIRSVQSEAITLGTRQLLSRLISDCQPGMIINIYGVGGNWYAQSNLKLTAD